jgi:hypothetical protein
MRTRKLGPFEVSALGLGCMSMSQAYGTPDLQECERALHRALDVGYTFLDTASIYGVGHNEKLIGRVLHEKRASFVLASKCGITVEASGGRGVDGSPASIKRTCEQSLVNLQTDVIILCRSRRASVRSPGWSPKGRSARSGCPKCRRRRFAARTPRIRSRRSSLNIRCGRASPNFVCSQRAKSLVSRLCRSVRWAAPFSLWHRAFAR